VLEQGGFAHLMPLLAVAPFIAGDCRKETQRKLTSDGPFHDVGNNASLEEAGLGPVLTLIRSSHILARALCEVSLQNRIYPLKKCGASARNFLDLQALEKRTLVLNVFTKNKDMWPRPRHPHSVVLFSIKIIAQEERDEENHLAPTIRRCLTPVELFRTH
jgi:hypothetical protein